MEEPLRNLLVEQLGVAREKVTLDATLAEMGADSLDSVELILAIEREFNVHISDEDSLKMDTMRKTLAYIEAHAEDGPA
jgi:acyl carrier protein